MATIKLDLVNTYEAQMASECGEHWTFNGENSAADTLYYKEELVRTAEFILPDGVTDADVIAVHTDKENGKPIIETKENVFENLREYNNAYIIGQRIIELRKEAGLTQTQLAEKCGMAQPNIARIEAGTYATSIDVLSRIAEALGKRIELV